MTNGPAEFEVKYMLNWLRGLFAASLFYWSFGAPASYSDGVPMRDHYCFYDQRCANAVIGIVNGFYGRGSDGLGFARYKQCAKTVFGPTGHKPTFFGKSFQSSDGSCWNIFQDGSESKVSDKPPVPATDVTIENPWEGVACYPDPDCNGARIAVVYDFRACKNGTYPPTEQFPGSKIINAKSFWIGRFCYNFDAVGKATRVEPPK